MELLSSTSLTQPFSSLPTIRFLTPIPSLPPLIRPPPLSRSTARVLRFRVLYFNNPLPKATASEETSSTGPNRFFEEDRDGMATLEEVPAVEKNVYNEKLIPEEPEEESADDEGSQMFGFLDNRDGVATLEEVPDVEKNVYNEKLTPEEPKEASAANEGSQMFDFLDHRDGVATLEEVPAVEKNVYNEKLTPEEPKEESAADQESLMSEFLEKLNIKLDSEDAYSIILYGSGALVALWLTSALVGAIDSIPLFPKLMEVVGLGYTFWFSSRYLLFKKNREELAAKTEELKQQVLGSGDD